MEQQNGSLELLQQEYREHPEDIAVAVNLAQHYCDLGWYNEAIEVYKEAKAKEPEDTSLLLEYGNTVFKKGDFAGAARIFKKVTRLRPDRIEGWNNLGIAQTKCDEPEKAHESFQRVLELEPEHPGALLNMGNYYFGRGDYEEARSYFERACATKKDFPDAWFNLGNTCIKLERYLDARRAFEKALRYRREFSSALKNLGWIFEHEGLLAEAQQCYTEALMLNKADARLYVNSGNVYVRQKKYDEAKKCFLKAVRLAPNDLHGWMGLRGYALAKGDIGTFVRSTLAVLGRLNDETLVQSIEILFELNQIDKAEEVLHQADRLGRSSDLLDLQRLLIYQRRGEEHEQISRIAERLAALPELTAPFHRGLARYYLHEGDFTTAVYHIEQIGQPDDTETGIKWRALLGLGQAGEVRRSIREYIGKHPESYDTYFLLARLEADRGNLKRAEVLLVHALDHGFNNMEEIYANSVLNDLFESMTGKKLLEEA